MIYMNPEDSNKIVEWASANLISAMFLVYEQILPNDAFGSTMLQNLKLRNIELRGIHAYPDLESQRSRFLSRGWNHAEAIDIDEIHDSHIDPKELARYITILLSFFFIFQRFNHSFFGVVRISKLEILDELEEWHLLASHYCIAWAYKAIDESQKSFYDQVRFDDYKKK